MTPLMQFILRALRATLIVCAGLVALFLAIEIWKNWLSGAEHVLAARDYGFLFVLVALFTGSIVLVRSISRELRK
jgi:formate hydrogenlyase subunit 3/multisubunit Na+/H+ antiporter MnhD subunit